MSEALAKDIIEFIMVNYEVVLSILSMKAIVDSLNYSKLECELQSLWLSEDEVIVRTILNVLN